jgi:hypothetical protein
MVSSGQEGMTEARPGVGGTDPPVPPAPPSLIATGSQTAFAISTKTETLSL